MSYEEARKVRGTWQVDLVKTARTWVHSKTDMERPWQARKFVAYTEVDVQSRLNDAWVRGDDSVDVAFVTDWGSPYLHHFDFGQMLVTSSLTHKARALQVVTEDTHAVIFNHDILFRPKKIMEKKKAQGESSARALFGTDIDAYHFWNTMQHQLRLEMKDPAAMQQGDTVEDATNRAAIIGACLLKCKYLPEENCFRWEWQNMRNLTIRVRDRITIRRCDTDAVAESTEFSVAHVDRVERKLFVKILEGTALLPIDVEEGMWRIDRVHDWLAHKLLQEDLKEFVLSDGHSEGVLRRLVVEDMDEESRAVLNDFRMSESVLAEVEPILRCMCLDDSQKTSCDILLEASDWSGARPARNW